MRKVFVEPRRKGMFLVSKASATLRLCTLAMREERYTDGTVLAFVEGEGVPVLAALEADTEGDIDTSTVAGVLYGNYSASAGPARAVFVSRRAEVAEAKLLYPEGTRSGIIAGLARLKIRTR